MKSLCRRFIVGALIVCLGFGSLGISPRPAEAGLPSIPKIPHFSGLPHSAIVALLHNPSAAHSLISKVKYLTKHGYVVKSASYNSLTGELTIYSKNIRTRQSHSDSIYIGSNGQNGAS